MSVIDGSYFINEITLANIKEHGSYTSVITNAIDKYEPEIMIDLLGYELYGLLIADLSKDIGDREQRFIDLVDGAEFRHPDTDQLLKWIGLQNTQKESLIAYYVFFNHVYNSNIQMSGLGTVRHEGKNSENVSPFDKLQVAWENFQRLYANFDYDVNECYFSEDGVLVDDLSGVFNTLPTAYNFLYANKDDYPEWVFKVKYDINIFNL